MPWSQLNEWLNSHMRSLHSRVPRQSLIALVVALWGGAAVMVWHELDSVGGWLGIVLVLFIASYVLLATLGGIGSWQRVRRRSGPLMVALVVAIEGATVAAFWYPAHPGSLAEPRLGLLCSRLSHLGPTGWSLA